MDLANKAGLFRKYASWHERDNNYNKTTHQSIIYSISNIMVAIESIEILKDECINQYELFKDRVTQTTDKTYFRSPSLDNIFIHLSTAITQLRILQNTIVQILPRATKGKTTNSMSEFYKKLNKYDYLKNNDEIKSTIKEYWNNHGIKIKGYRDFEQHFGVMYNHASIDKKTCELIIPLPDNPEEKSSNKTTYDKNIDAISFVQEQFNEIQNLLETISEISGYQEEQVFDYNMILTSNYDIMAIQFDPVKDSLFCQEGYFDNGNMKGLLHVQQGLSKYSFIKAPSYFKNKYSTRKLFTQTNEPQDCIDITNEDNDIKNKGTLIE